MGCSRRARSGGRTFCSARSSGTTIVVPNDESRLRGKSRRLQLDYVNLYSIHIPFAFKAGDGQDPRDEKGNVIYDDAATLTNAWKALESLVDEGRCKVIGLSNVV